MSTIPDLVTTYYPISASLGLGVLCFGCRPDAMENLACTDYLRLAVTELGFIATTLFGTIETIFWTSILLLAKAIHVFMPESEIADRIFTQICASTADTIAATACAALLVIYNLSNHDAELLSKLSSSLNDGLLPFAEKYLIGPINYRLFAESIIIKTEKEAYD